MLFKARHFLPINILICLYNSLFSPFLLYFILVWGLTYKTQIKPGFLLQTRAAREILVETYAAPSSPISRDLKISKLHDLFELKVLGFVYQFLHDLMLSLILYQMSINVVLSKLAR